MIRLFLMLLVLVPILAQANIYTVTTTNDGTMLPPGQVSLRQAMLSANSTPGFDSIYFAIPGPGPHTLRPTSQLPILTDQAGVRIDGFTQAGAIEGLNPPSSCVMMIEISGSQAGNASGIWINSSNNFITGLVIDSFAWDGISIEGIPAPGSNQNWIVSNFIGVDPSGTFAKPNGWFGGKYGGIALWHGPLFTTLNLARMNFIYTNLVSGNLSEGITMLSSPPDGDVAFNRVHKNHVGTDITGLLPIGNGGDGIYIGENSNHNVVNMNVASANGLDGIGMSGFLFLNPNPAPRYVTHNQIYWNIVGMGIDTLTPMGNGVHGIGIGTYGDTTYGFAEDNEVIGNWIAYNAIDGIRVADFPAQYGAPYVDCERNKLSMNQIYRNGLLGINLGEDTVTLNDPFDADSGANMLYNFPVLSNIQWNNGVTYMRTDLMVLSNPVTRFVEYYKVDRDPTGYGEGMEFIKQTRFPAGTSVIIDSFHTLMPYDSITAIVWDSAQWNTSEFSAVKHIRGPLQDSISKTDVLCFGDSSGSIELSLWWGSGYYRINWSNGVQDSLQLTNLPAGVYSVTFTDLVTAGAGMHTVTIMEPLPLNLNLAKQDPSCAGCSDGKIYAPVMGGVMPYRYQWSPSVSTTDSAMGLASGTYCMTVTDFHGCMDSSCIDLIDPVGIAEVDENEIKIYPNPVQAGQRLQIKGLLEGVDAFLFDLIGNEVEISRSNHSIIIPGNLQEGVYFLRLESNGIELVTLRVVVW